MIYSWVVGLLVYMTQFIMERNQRNECIENMSQNVILENWKNFYI